MSAPEEFQGFFQRTFTPLVGALWLYCGERAVAEEFAQEALARVARDWPRVRAMRAPQGWAYRVAFNLVHSHFRRRRIERRALARHAAREPTAAPSVATEQGLVVREAVGRLPERQRQAVVLFYFADLPVAEVAAVLETPENTVKSWLARARRALEAELSGSDGGARQEDADVY